ncbi:MAG TPA: GNAT family N-acetyltransferase [Anaerolineae bacterium]|nr:GNAT family N-acetyltransferase [Anaerolineae bacterium]HOQ98707.1 GNAT family N-acetyltransferase [Anaerolineae bacterium]HPL29249.1 GNAT family N-acetyltransferase [Anaerolineae bacterium]
MDDMAAALAREREAIGPLLSLTDPGDALTAYYALYHPAALTRLYVQRGASGRAEGFVATCTTGADLFRPLVVLRAERDRLLGDLLRGGLAAGRPYRFSAPLRYAALLEGLLRLTETRVALVLLLDVTVFEPVLNVLVVPAQGADGGLRFEIRSREGRVLAASGTNWRSPHFAEVYVYSEPEVRGRGFARSVASACTAALLEEGVRPLYVASEGDEASLGLAAGLGYRDSGHREWIAAGVREA